MKKEYITFPIQLLFLISCGRCYPGKRKFTQVRYMKTIDRYSIFAEGSSSSHSRRQTLLSYWNQSSKSPTRTPNFRKSRHYLICVFVCASLLFLSSNRPSSVWNCIVSSFRILFRTSQTPLNEGTIFRQSPSLNCMNSLPSLRCLPSSSFIDFRWT